MSARFWVLPLLVACSDPSLVEVDCANGVDDDGDGQIDCADVDCIEADLVCETTRDRCRDGMDNDGDERADCEVDSCVDAGFCEPFEPDAGCSVVEQWGCPVGMGCWLTDEGTPMCAPAGSAIRMSGDACDPDVALSQGCEPGTGCVDGICSDHCHVEADCRQDSRCYGLSPFCSTPCNPRQGDEACAAPGARCAPIQAFVPELTFAQGGGLFSCVAADPQWGSAAVGESCSRTLRCAEGLVCAPDLEGFLTCRQPCMVSPRTEDAVGCESPDDVCWPTYASHPSIDRADPAGFFIQGTCWAEGER